MIESYVYFDNIELKDFITSRRSMLSFEQYEWMREILDGADHLNNMEEIQSYDCIVCYVLKAFILKNTKDISIENKIKEFKEYCLSTLNVYMELEFFLLVRYLENDNSVQKIFEKLQIGAKKIVDRLYNVVWDIFHIRLVEQSFLNDCIKDKDVVHLHYFATADLGLSEVIKANPIKMIVYYNENMITIRKYNLSDIISSTERDKFFNKDAIKNRSIKVKKINFTDIKENLIKELEQLIK